MGNASYELMVLRVAWRTRSTYEWCSTFAWHSASGITIEEVEAIGRSSGCRELDAVGSRPARRDRPAIDRYCIEDDTWGRLAEQLDERQLVEMAFIVGTYTCLAMAFNSFGIEVDAGLDGRPAHAAAARCSIRAPASAGAAGANS